MPEEAAIRCRCLYARCAGVFPCRAIEEPCRFDENRGMTVLIEVFFHPCRFLAGSYVVYMNVAEYGSPIVAGCGSYAPCRHM